MDSICGSNRSNDSADDLSKTGIGEFSEQTTVTYTIQRNDPAHIVISITRIFSRLFAQSLMLSFALSLFIFSIINQLWFIFVCSLFWLLCVIIVMYPSMLIFRRTWHFKRESVQIARQTIEDVWNAECRSYGILGVGSLKFNKCNNVALRRKTVVVKKEEVFDVNYVSFQHDGGEMSLWLEADAPCTEKKNIFKNLSKIMGTLIEKQTSLISMEEYPEPPKAITPIVDTPGAQTYQKRHMTANRRTSLLDKILIKEVRLTMLERKKPQDSKSEIYLQWRAGREMLIKTLVSLRADLDGETETIGYQPLNYDSDYDVPPPVPPSDSSEGEVVFE